MNKLFAGFLAPVVWAMFLIGNASALPTLDYYTGNAADSIYHDTGAEYVSLTDTEDPQSTPTFIFGVETITSTYGHDFIIGIFDDNGNEMNILDTSLGITSNNVIFESSGSVKTASGGYASLMNTVFGYFLKFYTGIGTNILSGENYYSNNDSDDAFGIFYDPFGIASLGFAETAIALGDSSTQGHALIGVHDVAPTPEPGTLLLLGSGMAGLAYLRKRKKA